MQLAKASFAFLDLISFASGRPRGIRGSAERVGLARSPAPDHVCMKQCNFCMTLLRNHPSEITLVVMPLSSFEPRKDEYGCGPATVVRTRLRYLPCCGGKAAIKVPF